MLRRWLVILTCVSLIGVTVLPASALPCCCTVMHAKMGRQSATSHCPFHMSSAPAVSTVPPRPSCCPGEASVGMAAASCCPQGLIKRVCCQCRCHEQMQVVALPAVTSCELLGGLPGLTPGFHGPTSMALPKRGSRAGLNVRIARTGVLLQTCSLLI
jgi:hypothetical protein